MMHFFDQRPVVEDRTQRGVSLVEATIAMTILAALSAMIAQSIRALAATQVYARGQARVTDLAERLVQDVANDARFAVRVLTESPEDREFLEYLTLPSAEIMAGGKLPVVSEIGTFELDPSGDLLTGNVLVMVKSAPFALVDKVGVAVEEDMVRVDTYRFVIYHLTEGGQDRIDMARWSGSRMASHSDLVSITDSTEFVTAARALYLRNIRIAWDLNAPAAEAFYSIREDGSIAQIPRPNSKPVRRDDDQTVLALLGPRGAEIARNGSVTRVDVPRFATANATAKYPHGFEVKVDGGGSGQLMLIRIVVARRDAGKLANSAAVTRLVSIRSL